MLGGCRDFGAGGTGEFTPPTAQLRQVHTNEPENFPSLGPAATQPFILSTTQPTTQITEMPVTLQQVRQWAIQNNLELKVDLLDPTIARESIGIEQARFEAVFTTNASYGTTDNPFLTRDQNGNRVISSSQSELFTVTPGLRIPLITGGSIRLDAPYARREDSTGRIDVNTGLPTSDLQFSADAALTFSQPLLRGGGLTRNLAPIRIAYYRYREVEARTKRRVLTVLADADRQYWRVDAAIKLLQVQKQNYDSANDQLRRARRMVEVGMGVESDVLESEAAVAQATSNIINAESRLRGELRELKRIINQPGLELNSPILLRPADEPRFLAVRLDADRLADQAVRDRMEMLEAELRILQDAESLNIARNDLLPLLSVSYRYNANGLGTSAGDAFELLSDNDFADHSVGMQLEVPIGNQAARSAFRQALAQRLQTLSSRNLREQLVRNEVYASVANLEQSWQGILAARQSVLAESRVLASIIRKFERGQSSGEDVRIARDRLTAAQQTEVNAIRDYQISQIDLAAATGTLLGLAEVQWEPIPTPKE